MKIVFDIGGTNTRVAAATNTGIEEVVKEETLESPQEATAKLIASVRAIAGNESVETIVGGCPGTIQNNDVILRNPNRSKWAGYAFGSQLQAAFPTASVIIKNDADMAGLGEAQYGAGAGYAIVAYMGIGTGVGTTRIVSGAIDAFHFGFEAGHQIIDAKTGATLEESVGGRFVASRAGVHPKDVPRSEYDEMTPILAAGIYNAILHWSPDAFVLGGSMMNEENGFRLEDVTKALYALPMHFPEWPAIAKSKLGDSAALHGARALSFKTTPS